MHKNSKKVIALKRENVNYFAIISTLESGKPAELAVRDIFPGYQPIPPRKAHHHPVPLDFFLSNSPSILQS